MSHHSLDRGMLGASMTRRSSADLIRQDRLRRLEDQSKTDDRQGKIKGYTIGDRDGVDAHTHR